MKIESKNLNVFLNDRGYLFEVLRVTDEIFKGGEVKQITIGTVFPGVVKAWHKHNKQTDWICVVKGNAMLGLAKGKEKKKIFLGEKTPLVVRVDAGIWHGIKSLGNEEAVVLYITNQVYDPSDELRRKWDYFGEDFWKTEFK